MSLFGEGRSLTLREVGHEELFVFIIHTFALFR